MSKLLPLSFFIWAIIIQSLTFSKILSFSSSSSSSSSSWCPHHLIHQQTDRKFEQKATKFWEFDEKSETWVQVKLPYDLVYCVNDDNCIKVGSIDQVKERNSELIDQTGLDDDGFDEKQESNKKKKDDKKKKKKEKGSVYLPLRKRVSLKKMSETSIWVTGESGSIYERFWNGLQWVIAPHDLPVPAGYAVSVFIVNQTILALSEAGILYQLQISEDSQPIWVEFTPILDHNTMKDKERDMTIRLNSGVVSHDRERVYFCTKNGLLLELSEADLPRWITLGKPPGADVAAIADAASVRPQVIFTVSSTGDLYEFDRASKPLWKKHIWSEESAEDTALIPSTGCALHGTTGPHSISLFLLTKGGNLVERRLHQRKWKWIVHGSPEDHLLTSITPASVDESNERAFSLFLTTASGFVYEYHIPKPQGNAQVNQAQGTWVNHMHPTHSKAAKGIAGLQFQMGRIIFPLDDGRLGELHLPGAGGDGVGPVPHVNTRRRASGKYVWSTLDAPESEGWNAEYCTEEHGPSNCIVGVKDEHDNGEMARSAFRRRTGSRAQEHYYSCSPVSPGCSSVKSKEESYTYPRYWVNNNFRLRVMYEARSFFLVTEDGLVFEYLNAEDMWFWLRHEHSTAMRGALGNYNGSLFLVDENKDLMIRERTEKELAWINCTAMKKGRQVIGGPPWDLAPGKMPKVTVEDSLFFVSKSGKLLQFNVAMKNFKWKDCRSPSDTKIASIVDQEVFRENIVFVVGRNGRLYQYNRVTELWHGHYQSQHLVLSRNPGTAMRPSSQSLSGSLFMLSEDGKLIEYYWSSLEGWDWVEHGTPRLGVTLVGSTGPCFEGNQLFLIGSDGEVYIRYLDQATWKWVNCGFPYMGKTGGDNPRIEEICIEPELSHEIHQENKDQTDNCDPKVAPIRPIPFMEDSVIFELRDGRLAEMKRTEDLGWVWQRTIGTPTSHCNVNYWTATAS